MKNLFLICAATVMACGVGFGGEVVIPQDNTPFTVQEGATVRVTAKGIAGTTVTAKVNGPAKEQINSVSTRVKGRMPIGPGNHEVDVVTNGKGKVTLELTITPPNGPAKTEKYEFTVE